MPEQATQSTLEGNFKLIELLYYHSKCVPIFRACREGTCLTPGLKTEHLVYKCINYLTQRTKSGAQIWSSALSKFLPSSLPVLPVLPPGGILYSTWTLSQIRPLGITCIWDCIINLYLGREVLTCNFQLFVFSCKLFANLARSSTPITPFLLVIEKWLIPILNGTTWKLGSLVIKVV